MENILHNIIVIAFMILKIICLYRLYADTLVDPFQDYFLKDEKQNFFTKNYNNEIELELECSFLENMIMEPDTIKLGNVFNLNYYIINSSSFFLIISDIGIYCSFLLLLLLGILAKFFSFLRTLNLLYINIFYWLIIGYCILVLIYNYYLLSSYYNSNIAFFLDFLKCPNVNKDGFKKYYDSALIFKSDFRIYIELFFIHLMYNCCLRKIIERL